MLRSFLFSRDERHDVSTQTGQQPNVMECSKCRVCGEGELASRARWIGCDGEDRKKIWLLMSLPLHWTQSENKSCPMKDLLVLPSPSGSSFTIELKNWVHVVGFLFGFFFLYLIIIVCVCLHFYKILTEIYYLWNIIIYNISVFYLF